MAHRMIMFAALALLGCQKQQPSENEYGPVQIYEAVWTGNWEYSSFWPCTDKECPNIDVKQCHARILKSALITDEISKHMQNGLPVRFVFWGRATTNPDKHYGHLGAYNCQMIAEKIIYANPSLSLSVRSARFKSGD